MKTLKEKIEVMQAALDGKDMEKMIQSGWSLVLSAPQDTVFSWGKFDYRVKPEPLEFWMVKYDWGVTSSTWETKEAATAHVQDVCDEDETFTVFKVREVVE